MRSVAADVRSRVARSRKGTFFAVTDYPVEKRAAVEVAFSRLVADEKVFRVRRGLYWKGGNSRFGVVMPSSSAVFSRVARGKGYGPTGWTAGHALGLTDQVPARPSYVVVGAVPAGVDGVRISSRSNLARLELEPLEVGLLEVLREYPRHVDTGWERLVDRVRELAASDEIRLERVTKAAETERSPRLRECLGALQRQLLPEAV